MPTKSLGTLTLDLVARTAGFVRGMDAAERKSAQWKRKVKRNIDETTKSLQRLAVIGAAGVTAAFGAVVAASVRQEAAIKQLEARIKSTGGAAGKTSEGLQKMAAELQKTTTFGDEAVIELQSMLLTFTSIRGEIFDKTIPAILDLSVAMGQDLKSSAVQLGKALNDPIANLSALSRTGIQFSDNQEKVIKALAETGRLAEAQAIILDELNRQFGGAAAAAADTFGGALAQVKNAFGDLLENPSGLEANKEAIKDLVSLLQDPATVESANKLTSALISGFRNSVEFIREAVNVVEFLHDEVLAFFGDIDAFDRVRLDERLAEINDKLNNKLFTTLATQERINELLEEREAIQNRIARLDAPLFEIDISAIRAKKLKPIKLPVTPVIDPSKELKNISVISKKLERTPEVERILQVYDEYYAIVRATRTEEEKLSEELRDRIAIINEIGISEEKRADIRKRVLDAAFGDAPDVGGLAPEVGGAFGELDRLNEEQAKLEEWYQENLSRLQEYRDEKLILESEYNAKEQELKQQHEEALANIEKARQQASLIAAEDLFGNLADITKQFAGEQSDAYKVLFAIEKGAAIARSIVAIQAAIAQAAASGPFPANLAAMASVASATAGLISTIASTSIQGQAHDGLMNVPKTGTYILEQGERVVSAETTKKMDRQLDGAGSNIRIINSFDPADVVGGYMGSAAGEKVVMNIVQRNARTIRSLSA